MMKKILLTTLILLFAVAPTAMATQYWVADSSHGTGTGLSYDNRMSVSTHNSMPFNPVDIINVCGLIDDNKLTISSSGTSLVKLLYQGCATDPPTIDYASSSGGIQARDCDYVHIDDIDFIDGTIGLSLYDVNHITVTRCKLYRMSSKGIHATGDGRNSYITIGGSEGMGNEVYEVGYETGGGDYAFNKSDDVIVSYNKGIGDPTGPGTDGTVWTNCKRILIEKNWFKNHKSGYPIGEDGTDMKGVDGAIVRYNVFENNRMGGPKINLYEPTTLPCNNIIVCHNLSLKNGYNFSASGGDPGEAHDNLYVWGNIFFDSDTSHGTVIASQGENFHFYNNTVVGWISGYSGHYLSRGSDFYTKNNIFKGIASNRMIWANVGTSEVDLSTNLYHISGGTPQIYWNGSWQSAILVDTAGIVDNPLFVNLENADFRLQPTSPAIDEGLDLSSVSIPNITVQGATYHFNFNTALGENTDWTQFPPDPEIVTRTGDWDLGAYEYGTGVTLPDPEDPPANETGMAIVNGETAPIVNGVTGTVINGLVPDSTPPTVDSVAIDTTGLLCTVTLSEDCTGNSGFTISASGGGTVTLAYASGTGTTRVYDVSRAITYGEIVSYSYSAGDVQDAYGNPLDTIVDGAVTNNVPSGTACNTTYFSETAEHGIYVPIKTASDRVYIGQKDFVPATDGSLCSITVAMNYTDGDISGLNYTISVYTPDGDNLGTLLATSDAIAGDNSWNNTDVTFVFSTPLAMVTTSTYDIVITHDGTAGSSNEGGISFTTAGVGSLSGVYARWESDFTLKDSADRNLRCTAYKMGP